ncbi:hypothetical protein BH11ARM1_BH11ARM1_10540 [soil metagenome]
MSDTISAPTIYASFPNADDAQKAAGALMDHGVPAENISLIISKEVEKEHLEFSHPQILVRDHGTSYIADPMDNSLRDTPIAIAPGLGDQDEIVDSEMASHPAVAGPIVETEKHAEDTGITTTTLPDAASGAAKGALWGVGVGALAAVAALAVPGFGIILGGGALAAGVAALVGTAGAGAVAGGVVGYLKDQGVPAEHIPHYKDAIDAGGALLAIHLEPTDDRLELEQVIQKYGAGFSSSYGYVAP